MTRISVIDASARQEETATSSRPRQAVNVMDQADGASERNKARVNLGRLLGAALSRGQREARAAEGLAVRSLYRPNPALLRELNRCLRAAKAAR